MAPLASSCLLEEAWRAAALRVRPFHRPLEEVMSSCQSARASSGSCKVARYVVPTWLHAMYVPIVPVPSRTIVNDAAGNTLCRGRRSVSF